jgi:hypothetical protein
MVHLGHPGTDRRDQAQSLEEFLSTKSKKSKEGRENEVLYRNFFDFVVIFFFKVK